MVNGVAGAVNAVAQHALAFQRQQGQGQAAVEVLARLHPVPGVFREALGPGVETARVQRGGVVGVEAVNGVVQQQALQVGLADKLGRVHRSIAFFQ